ncbi:hypothetical protein [Catellatospora coxensis]|uniref:hypothetical protein n=2 Tax=Catellatospora coxensis TaxID=310354 RepID=UPI0031D2018C
MVGRRKWKGHGLTVLVVGVAVGAVAWPLLVDRKPVGAVVSGVVAALVTAFLPLLVGAVRGRFIGSPATEVLSAEAERLAGMVLGRVVDSPVRVRLNHPMPLRVRFRTVPELGADRAAVTGEDGPDWREEPLSGDVGQVADRLRKLPWKQLVVLGEPGAGKSVLAVMLVHQLLTAAVPGDPVPVLVGVSSWDPRAEPVAKLMARRLREDFGLGEDVARRLVGEARAAGSGRAGFWVLPVLDGLDEIEPSLQAAGLVAIQDYAAGDRPVVVMCRVREFEQAVAAVGVLSRAAVVRLEPLRPSEVADYLAYPSDRRQAWAPVFDVLQEQPSGVLAGVLSTPLMAGLAKDAYARRDPAELARVATPQQARGLLIDGYVASAYRDGDPQISDVSRWLGNLAYLAYLDGTRDLRWWQLPWAELVRGGPRAVQVAAAGVTGLGVGAPVVALYGWQTGVVWALLAGLGAVGAFGRVFGQPFQPAATRIPVAWRWAVRWAGGDAAVRAGVRLWFGALCGIAAGALAGDPVAGAAVGVLCAGLVAILPGGRWQPRVRMPAATLRANHLLAAAAAVRYSAAGALLFAASAVLLAQSPARWSLAGLAAFAVSGGLAGGWGRWLRFRLAHLAVLILGGREPLLPRRLIQFIQDGTSPDVAVMRVNGTVWQFRHALIQDHLLDHSRAENLRRRADAGDGEAAWELAGLLRERGDIAGVVTVLRHRANADDASAARELTRLLRERGDVDGAVAVLRRRADAGDREAARELAGLLRECGDVDGAVAVLRRRADAGGWEAARELALLLRELGDVGELGRRADAGDEEAAWVLALLLRELGDVGELGRRADAGDEEAASALAWLLRELGDVGALRRRAEAGDGSAARVLAGLLAERGDVDGAVAVLRRRADGWDGSAARELAGLLRERGDVDGAVAVLRRRADVGDREAARQLAGLLRERGDVDELRRRADAGDWGAVRELAGLLRERGDVDGAVAVLRRRADAGDGTAAQELAGLLRECGDVDGAVGVLRRRADAGDREAASALVGLLRELGDVDELRRRADAGDLKADSALVGLLRELGDVDELRRRADAGDEAAAFALVGLLLGRGDVDELRRRADAGYWEAASALVGLLRERGDIDGVALALGRHADAGDWGAARELAGLLQERGDVDALRRRADAGDGFATYALARLLRERRDVDGAVAVLRRRADIGDATAARELTGLLRERGDVDGAIAVLARRADAGDGEAARELAGLQRERGDV